MDKVSDSAEELAALFKEIRADEAAGKREDAHWYGREAHRTFQKTRNEKANAPAVEQEEERGIER